MNPTKIANELIGMLNADGGVLAFGVANDGTLQDLSSLDEKLSEYRNLYVDFIEPHGNIKLEEVVIAATRSSRTIQDIPTRIEAITGEELGEKAAMNSTNIGMLLRETTGVHMQQTSLSSGNMSIRIQGLDGRYTQILKDGMPLYGGFAGGRVGRFVPVLINMNPHFVFVVMLTVFSMFTLMFVFFGHN